MREGGVGGVSEIESISEEGQPPESDSGSGLCAAELNRIVRFCDSTSEEPDSMSEVAESECQRIDASDSKDSAILRPDSA
jgi:hypothetical protein